MNTLNDTVIWIGTGVILVSFIISIFSKNDKTYMHGFFFCILIALLVSINTICCKFVFLYDIEICFFIQSILILLDLTFWTLFFLKLLNDIKKHKIIKILFIITLSLALYILNYNSTGKSNLHVAALLNICKTIFCILFYHNLFKKISNQNILLEPSFWIVNGLIFYSCLSIPLYGLNSYIKLQFSPLIYYNILSISNMLIIIMYLFFIKAYLCKITLRKA